MPLKLAIQRNTVAWGRLNSFLLSGSADCPIQELEPHAWFWGVATPNEALLDPMVGEPVAYATGSPELKAIGTGSFGLLTPRSPGLGVKSNAGAYRIDFRGESG